MAVKQRSCVSGWDLGAWRVHGCLGYLLPEDRQGSWAKPREQRGPAVGGLPVPTPREHPAGKVHLDIPVLFQQACRARGSHKPPRGPRL